MSEWKEFTPEQQGDGAGYSCKKAEYRQVGNKVESRFMLQQVGKFYKYGPAKHIPLNCRIGRAWRRIRYLVRECFAIAYSDIFVNKTESTLVECEEAESTMMEYTIMSPTPFNVYETKPHDND